MNDDHHHRLAANVLLRMMMMMPLLLLRVAVVVVRRADPLVRALPQLGDSFHSSAANLLEAFVSMST